jgi:protein-L-isoaspartate(D-aspartate) O-methyltransferase
LPAPIKPQMKSNYAEERKSMLDIQIKSRGIKDAQVLEAMEKVRRHVFVPENMIKYAYNDEPLPIGKGQTISQPYIVAYMTEVLQLTCEGKVLEVGTGSGYQAAVLAEIAGEVFTVEIIDELSKNAQEVLRAEGYTNIHFRVGDGAYGWEEEAPYDAIMVTAAPPEVPRALQEQLKIGGRMIVPVGDAFQELVLIVREKRRFRKKKLLPVRFVPLVKSH